MIPMAPEALALLVSVASLSVAVLLQDRQIRGMQASAGNLDGRRVEHLDDDHQEAEAA